MLAGVVSLLRRLRSVRSHFASNDRRNLLRHSGCFASLSFTRDANQTQRRRRTMKTFTKALFAVAVTSVGPVAMSEVAGAADFGPAPDAYYGTTTYGTTADACPGGVCPPGNCTTGACLAGGCADGNCNVGLGSDPNEADRRYGADPRYGTFRPSVSQPANSRAYSGTTARPYQVLKPVVNCPGGICPPTSGASHRVGSRPQAPAGCATGNCPVPATQWSPVRSAPRFSFLGLRF